MNINPTFCVSPVIVGEPTMDFRGIEMAQNLNAEQWASIVRINIKSGFRGNRNCSKAQTKIAVAMQAPDGRVIVTGVTVPDRTLDVRGSNIIKEPTLQRMGIDEGGKRVIQASGNKPALLQDAIEGGMRVLAILHFTMSPTVIFDVFTSGREFDLAWSCTPKTTGRNIQPPELRAAIPRAANIEERINREIDKMAELIVGAKTPDERQVAIDYTRHLYARLDYIVGNNQDLTGDALAEQ